MSGRGASLFRFFTSNLGVCRASARFRRSRPCRRDGVSGPLDRRARPFGGRGGFQHRDDRLPGNPHRSLLLPPDRHPDLSAHRQHRGQCGRRRGLEGACGWVGGARSADDAFELARGNVAGRLSEEQERGGDCRPRHPQADALAAGKGGAERLPDGGRRRCREGAGRGAGISRPVGNGSGEGRHHGRAL